MLVWFLKELRPEGPSYLVEHRGVQLPASPELVATVMGWGGKIVCSTYRARK